MVSRRSHLVLLLVFFGILIWSAIRPHDYFTWILEVFPALLALILLLATGRRFPLTTLTYSLICLHAIILMIGGHYTYAEVPLGFWMRDMFHLARNDYDRIGHFAQGFIPAMVAREVLIRKRVVNGKGWRYFVIVAICLAVSALYELLEWRVAVGTGAASDAFLGTQGDPWDTQEDMATALVGAMIAPLALGWLQDRQIRAVDRRAADSEQRAEVPTR